VNDNDRADQQVHGNACQPRCVGRRTKQRRLAPVRKRREWLNGRAVIGSDYFNVSDIVRSVIPDAADHRPPAAAYDSAPDPGGLGQTDNLFTLLTGWVRGWWPQRCAMPRRDPTPWQCSSLACSCPDSLTWRAGQPIGRSTLRRQGPCVACQRHSSGAAFSCAGSDKCLKRRETRGKRIQTRGGDRPAVTALVWRPAAATSRSRSAGGSRLVPMTSRKAALSVGQQESG
jgi:hypothetical protein